jgi:hypothetical protein
MSNLVLKPHEGGCCGFLPFSGSLTRDADWSQLDGFFRTYLHTSYLARLNNVNQRTNVDDLLPRLKAEGYWAKATTKQGGFIWFAKIRLEPKGNTPQAGLDQFERNASPDECKPAAQPCFMLERGISLSGIHDQVYGTPSSRQLTNFEVPKDGVREIVLNQRQYLKLAKPLTELGWKHQVTTRSPSSNRFITLWTLGVEE